MLGDKWGHVGEAPNTKKALNKWEFGGIKKGKDTPLPVTMPTKRLEIRDKRCQELET